MWPLHVIAPPFSLYLSRCQCCPQHLKPHQYSESFPLQTCFCISTLGWQPQRLRSFSWASLTPFISLHLFLFSLQKMPVSLVAITACTEHCLLLCVFMLHLISLSLSFPLSRLKGGLPGMIDRLTVPKAKRHE